MDIHQSAEHSSPYPPELQSIPTDGPDIEVMAVGPLRIEQATAQGGYPPELNKDERYKPGPTSLGYGSEAPERALVYAQTLFPHEPLSILSTEGSSAIVLHDENGRAYKVYRCSSDYSYIEHEAGSLMLLSSLGIAPKLHALVDAAPGVRTESPDRNRASFGDISIPRIESAGAFAVLVMDELAHRPVTTMGIEDAVQEIARVAQIAGQYDLVFNDVEPVVDNKTGQLILIDAGGVHRHSRYPELDMLTDSAYQGLDEADASMLRAFASLATNITMSFRAGYCSPKSVRFAWDAGGLYGAQRYVAHMLYHAQLAAGIDGSGAQE